MVGHAITQLIKYADRTGLIAPVEETWAVNALLEVLQLDDIPALDREQKPELALHDILDILLYDAIKRGLILENSIAYRDLFDTKIMGAITPRPAQVQGEFFRRYQLSPQSATNWYYSFSQDTNYIRRDRSAKDLKWTVKTEYGSLDITINLAKPEKDPAAIAAAASLRASNYPKCLLCAENEGYAGRLNSPARQNHRIVPLSVGGKPWFLQYSPYVYYNEHCILLNSEHVPMKIDGECFAKLLDFVGQFPHYMMGSNADLPIVGGSILSHEHFQGGHYTFAMERAEVEDTVKIPGYLDVSVGIVKWPMSVVRLTGSSLERLRQLGEKILSSWRAYSDPEALVLASTDGEPHNTITPIARRRGDAYELDLVLRNNRTTPEHPLGIFHPHSELHHIKRENIGLIEVMGLAVLPARLKGEMEQLAQLLVDGGDPSAREETAKHTEWMYELRQRHQFTPENVQEILEQEIGLVFLKVLEHCGVYKRTTEGKAAFLRFLNQVFK